MARYIDADKLLDLIRDHDAPPRYGYLGLWDIEDAPTEDVQPVVHAKWFLDEDSSSEEEKCYRCSNCQAILEEDYKWHNHNYCYHCGAKMDNDTEHYIRDIFMTR